jgi:hypothetical protein
MPGSASGEASVIFIHTRFQSMARRPGGISRERAIEMAETHLDQLQPDFSAWLDRELELMMNAIPADGSEVSSSDRWIEAAYAHCRAVRDVGATMGFDLVTFVANNLCEVIEIVRAGVECPFDTINCHVRALLLARQDADHGRGARRLRDSIGEVDASAESAGFAAPEIGGKPKRT